MGKVTHPFFTRGEVIEPDVGYLEQSLGGNLLDVDDKILALIREQILYHIIRRDIGARRNPNQQHRAADIIVETQLTRLEIDIPRQDIVKDNVFDKVATVIFFVVILFDARERNRQQRGKLARLFVGTLHEQDVLRTRPGSKRLVGIAVLHKGFLQGKGFGGNRIGNLPNASQITAGNNGHSLIDNAYRAVNRLPHLMNDALK